MVAQRAGYRNWRGFLLGFLPGYLVYSILWRLENYPGEILIASALAAGSAEAPRSVTARRTGYSGGCRTADRESGTDTGSCPIKRGSIRGRGSTPAPYSKR